MPFVLGPVLREEGNLQVASDENKRQQNREVKSMMDEGQGEDNDDDMLSPEEMRMMSARLAHVTSGREVTDADLAKGLIPATPNEEREDPLVAPGAGSSTKRDGEDGEGGGATSDSGLSLQHVEVIFGSSMVGEGGMGHGHADGDQHRNRDHGAVGLVASSAGLVERRVPNTRIVGTVAKGSEATFLLARDVDCDVFTLRGAAGAWAHVASIPALAYVSGSKREKRFVLASRDHTVAAIVEVSRYVFLYERSYASRGRQAVADLGVGVRIVGAHFTSNRELLVQKADGTCAVIALAESART